MQTPALAGYRGGRHPVGPRSGRTRSVAAVSDPHPGDLFVVRTDLAGSIAAKNGVEGPLRALARELGPDDITVNTVRPGSAVPVPPGRLIRLYQCGAGPTCW